MKSTTKSTADFINEQIAKNAEIAELKQQVDNLTKHIEKLYMLKGLSPNG